MTEDWNDYQKILEADKEQENKLTYCHGDYQYHNILFNDNKSFMINFA